jgi:hypothetical protein
MSTMNLAEAMRRIAAQEKRQYQLNRGGADIRITEMVMSDDFAEIIAEYAVKVQRDEADTDRGPQDLTHLYVEVPNVIVAIDESLSDGWAWPQREQVNVVRDHRSGVLEIRVVIDLLYYSYVTGVAHYEVREVSG